MEKVEHVLKIPAFWRVLCQPRRIEDSTTLPSHVASLCSLLRHHRVDVAPTLTIPEFWMAVRAVHQPDEWPKCARLDYHLWLYLGWLEDSEMEQRLDVAAFWDNLRHHASHNFQSYEEMEGRYGFE